MKYLAGSGISTIIALTLCGCQSMKTTTDLGKDYQSANQAAVDSLSAEANEVKRVRRVGAVVAYINNPSLDINENLNSDSRKVPGSFVNFVCTGADDFEITNAGLHYTTDYANTVKSITSTPDDSISGYVSVLSSLKGKDKPLETPEIQENQFATCRISVGNDIPPKGFTAATARKESVAVVIAAITAVQTLIQSVEAIVKDGLKMATEADQRATLRRFIENNRKDYNRVLSRDLNTDELTNAFARRRTVSIALPYYEFEQMMKLSPSTDRVEIIKAAIKINQDLTEYDAIRIKRPPALLTSQFKSINERLDDYANGKISLSDLRQFLSETAAELQQDKKDYDAIAKAVPPVLTDLGKK